MWDLPGPGIAAMYPALAGGFLTTAPPGKSEDGQIFKVEMTSVCLRDSKKGRRDAKE